MRVLGCVTLIAMLIASAANAAAPAAGSEPAAGSRPAASSQPAVWASQALIVDLRNLPKRYTCDELWYKFKAVLLALGARPDMQILPYRCGRVAGSAGSSPKVQLQFSIPRAVSGKDVRWADIEVSTRSIRLRPGSPGRIDVHDCDLLNQMRSTLLAYIGAAVTGFELACQAPQPSEPAFGLTVKALIPLAQSPPHVVSAAPADHLGHFPRGRGS